MFILRCLGAPGTRPLELVHKIAFFVRYARKLVDVQGRQVVIILIELLLEIYAVFGCAQFFDVLVHDVMEIGTLFVENFGDLVVKGVPSARFWLILPAYLSMEETPTFR